MGRILLNLDLGELPGEPDELYDLCDVACIACGGHAGDDASMTRAVRACRRAGARLGAHPSYPDREGFGRRRLALAAAPLGDEIAWQCARLLGVALRADLGVEWVKPHGALYHVADEDPAIASAVADGAVAALGTSITMIGRAGGALHAVAAARGLAFAREGYADRAVRDGKLVPRGEPGAVLGDPAAAAEQARNLAATGHVDTICVHSDTPGALAIARAVRAILQ